ncbi:MAG: response regulator [Deltaproteobacteria bacterium]|nr:response regulator [Deltaproteobacteria bacterium]
MTKQQGLHLTVPDSEVRKLLEQMFAMAPVAVMITDAEGNVIGVNQAHYELTGLDFNRIVNELKMNFPRYLRVVNPQMAERLERVYQGEVLNLGEFFYRVEGGPGIPVLSDKLAKGFWLNSRAFPIKEANGKVTYVVIFNEDITAKKELEGQLFQAQKMETIGTLAGGLAHDFNNILSGVVGYASLLAARLPTGSTDHDAARTILDAADRASTLTSHLLTIARRSVPSLTVQRPGAMLPQTVEFLRRTLGPRFPIRLELDDDLYPIEADRPQIEQVVTNLCLNAKDAMPDGGEITITGSNRSFGTPFESPCPDLAPGDYVEIAISDQGVGMPPDVVDRVFEPFFTTKEMGRGTGLGLAIVYGIVKSHHGCVSVRSEPGEGTTFSIFLPKAAMDGEEAEDMAPHEQGTSTAVGTLEVLVVDDDPMVRRVLCDMLYKMGHRPSEADGVQKALGLLGEDWNRYDVLVVDLVMPDMDGFDLVEAMRRTGTDTPVLLCTGFSSPDVYIRAANVSGVKILPKPFDMQAFSEAVEEAARPDRSE